MTDLISFSFVTVGVADLDSALELWEGALGMQVIARHDGGDAELAALLDIEPDDIARQALLETEGQQFGKLHLVQFTNPGATVRDGAQVFDLCPKNLDIYVGDMPERLKELKALGYSFRNDKYSEATAPDGTQFREMHMPSHDDINIVLLEVLSAKKPLNEKGYAGVGPLIYIVPDAGVEKQFLSNVLGLDKLNDNLLDGPEIEAMVGLPKGAGLDVSIWGRKGYPLGELEIVDYQGVEGANLYSRAKAPARGVLQVSFAIGDRSAVEQRLQDTGFAFASRGASRTLFGQGDVITIVSPAGLRIDIWEVSQNNDQGK